MQTTRRPARLSAALFLAALATAACQPDKTQQLSSNPLGSPPSVASSAPAAPTTAPPPATRAPATTPTVAPKATPKPAPKPPPPKPVPVRTTTAPKPVTPSTCGAPANTWGYNFCGRGGFVYDPPATFCDVFDCIPSFWESTNGYVMQCDDLTYSHSGGRSGSCSHHGGNYRALYG
jgi:hypothetical protein